MKIYVIAGNVQEARHWANENFHKRVDKGDITSSMNDYVLVTDPVNLRGVQNPHGVFVGNWKYRDNIKEILQELRIASIHKNPTFDQIQKELDSVKKPTPKLSGAQIYSMVVDEAASLMAKSIDDEVLKQLTKL